ncbi:MAG TPA: ATP-binding protein [Bryobacteraceae bacterium]|jgi:two-component system, OmpR family, sensor histidine kinase KdpD|nr:ATP-binding protein [Bryobacteraceae bacterium]
MRQRTWIRLILRIAIMGTGLPAVSALYHYTIRANTTTAALTYLLVVVWTAVVWGLPEAMLASVLGVLCLDYYFLPPVPGFGIDDPQNWVAWGAFLITALLVSHLSARLKKRALEATQRQREIERMYALSRRLMQGSAATALAQSIPGQVAEIFGCPGVAFFDGLSGQVYRTESAADISDTALLDMSGCANSPRAAGGKATLVAVNLDATAIGSLGFTDAAISAPAMQSIANLVALAMDRVRKQEAAAQAEGARRHQEMKSMLLDALAHEFQTPLTSIRASIDAMLSESPGRDQQEWLEIMNEESRRLSAMMTEAIQMARIEAGHVDLDRQTHTVEDLVYSALEKEIAAGSQVEIDLPQGLPPVDADAGLIRLVIRQIAGNALKYSQPGAPITVRAHATDAGVVISVTDRGPGIPAEEQRQIFERYYRGKHGRGHLTGMGMGLPIARQVVEAHNGRVWVESRPGEGATFSFTLPLAHEEANV